VWVFWLVPLVGGVIFLGFGAGLVGVSIARALSHGIGCG
jgi:hypothetical protein